MNMPVGEGRKLSNQELQLVQNRIERCLQHYMTKKEVVNTLCVQDNIEPGFTEIVWQRLEQENPDFFKAYYLKLLVKDQIMEFNRLLSEQAELMRQIGLNGIAPVLPSNGSSHVTPSQPISTSCVAQNIIPLRTNDHNHMPQPNVFLSCGGPSIQSGVQGTVNGNVHSTKLDASPNLFVSQNPNVGLAQAAMNGKTVKTEGGGYGDFDFSPPPGNFMESRALMGDASVSSFSSVESNAQHMNGSLLDGGDAPSFGFFSQISQSFNNLPELAADFTTTNPDLLESYCRSPFLGTDANNFGDPHEDVERLDPGSENLRYQCFGGD